MHRFSGKQLWVATTVSDRTGPGRARTPGTRTGRMAPGGWDRHIEAQHKWM